MTPRLSFNRNEFPLAQAELAEARAERWPPSVGVKPRGRRCNRPWQAATRVTASP